MVANVMSYGGLSVTSMSPIDRFPKDEIRNRDMAFFDQYATPVMREGGQHSPGNYPNEEYGSPCSVDHVNICNETDFSDAMLSLCKLIYKPINRLGESTRVFMQEF